MTTAPGPRGAFFGLGLARRLRNDRIGALADLAREYGDVVAFRVGPQRFALLNHPDYVEDVLVSRARLFRKGRALERAKPLLGEGLLTSEGAHHLRQRRLAQPAFHRRRIEAYAETMIAHASRAVGRFDDGGDVDIASEMNRLTLTIVGETLFGVDVTSDAGGVREALTAVLEAFPTTMSPFAPLLERLPSKVMRRYSRARRLLDDLIYKIIRERRTRGRDTGDLLSMLLLARDEAGDGSGMTDRQVRDEAMTMFLAGHETTANALSWTWALLAQHPGVERLLHEEIARVTGSRDPVPDDYPALSYTRAILSESMRLFPPAWGIGRRAIEPFELGGYTIPRDTIVLVSQYLLQRDGRFFAEPERFEPERWLAGRAERLPRFAYFPFGGGNRVCIGEAFVWTEGVLVLAPLARRWRFDLLDPLPIPIQPGIVLRPARGIRMRAHSRT